MLIIKKIFRFPGTLLLVGLFFFSCRKQGSCEDCSNNKPPVANAGSDITVTMLHDSVVLNGSASYDEDGNIVEYLWSKISGPSAFTIINSQSIKVTLKYFTVGVYQFELKVTDNGGLHVADTVRVTVEATGTNNHSPIADAGQDRTITLPNNTVILDGSLSFDPDNNITVYQWSKISGPLSFNIANPSEIQTQVTSLVEGTYQFELKVTDAGGLLAKDTIQVTVQTQPVILPCSNRPLVNVNLIPVGALSEARVALASGAAGGKILFAGGFVPFSHYSSRVDIYNTITNTWSTAELTSPERQGMAVASVGNKILFAGGGDNDNGITTSRVDIYNADDNSWSIAELTEPREYLAAAVLGNKVFFSGGGTWRPNLKGSRIIDIYDNSTNTWTTDYLSEERMDHSATVIGNKIYFAGGTSGYYTSLNVLNTIDIYDGTANSWATSAFHGDARMQHAAIAADNKIFWASGTKYASLGGGFLESDNVEIRNLATGTSTYACISPRTLFNAVLKNDNIVFFTGLSPNSATNRIDIYNTTSETWSVGILPVNIYYSTIIAVHNTIYVAGGYVNGSVSAQVWKLEF